MKQKNTSSRPSLTINDDLEALKRNNSLLAVVEYSLWCMRNLGGDDWVNGPSDLVEGCQIIVEEARKVLSGLIQDIDANEDQIADNERT